MEEKTKIALALYDWLLNKEHSEFPDTGFSFGTVIFMPQRMTTPKYTGRETFIGGEGQTWLDVELA